MQYLLMLNYIGKDPEKKDEEEKEQESTQSGGTAKAQTTEEDEAREKLAKLKQSIERTREEAVEKNGTDKNKYAFAIELYNKAKEEEGEVKKEKILSNGQVVKDENRDNPKAT